MNWPDGSKYCVHIFRAAVKAGESPTLVDRRFSATLLVPDAPFPDFRLRRSGAYHWWTFAGSYPRGWWWAKAHDRTFDCEANWPEAGWKVAA